MARGKNSRGFAHAPNGTKLTSPPNEARTVPYDREFPANVPHAHGGYTGTVVCARCHAIWDHKHWHLNEDEYSRLRQDETIEKVVCPGCEKVERGEYDGQVTLRSSLIPENEQAIMGLIHNTEEHIREHNPLARIASLQRKGDTIEVLTISPFLAERIGKELRKAYHGQLEINHSERAEFVRVTWIRE